MTIISWYICSIVISFLLHCWLQLYGEKEDITVMCIIVHIVVSLVPLVNLLTVVAHASCCDKNNLIIFRAKKQGKK